MSALQFGGLAVAAAVALLVSKARKKSRSEAPKEEPITIAYWNMCGLGQPLRLILAYSKLPFKDMRYQVTRNEDGSWNRTHWSNEKLGLGLDFPNLPYLIHGDYRLTESNAILRYVAELSGLGGSTPAERGTVAMLLNVVFTLRNWVVGVAYKSEAEYPAAIEWFKAQLPQMLTRLQSYVGDKDWLCEWGITAPDFHLYEMLRQTELMVPGTLAGYEGLAAYKTRFEALPTIRKYMESDDYIDRPLNNPYAAFK